MTAQTVYTPGALDIVHGLALEEDAARSKPAPDPRQRYMALLRDVAGLLDEHEQFPAPYVHGNGGLQFCFGSGPEAAANLAALIRVLGGNWAKDPHDDYLWVKGEWHGFPVLLTISRDSVCRRVVVGTEEREVEKVITPAVTEKVTEQVEIVEWICEPVLAGRPAETDVAA